jgi:hypothetical protein
LNERTQRSYLQHYQTRLNKLSKGWGAAEDRELFFSRWSK